VAKFFADRGTHLAAMVAYFALLSFVPLIFLALSLLGLVHRADASDFLVKELSRAFPTTSLKSILKLVHRVQDNATTLGVVGGVALLWSSLSLFSALESAFNIVYGRPNRSFLRGKALAATLMVATITTLFVSLIVGAVGVEILKRQAPGFVSNPIVAYIVSIAVSLLGIFVFLLAVYWFLPTAEVTFHDALPGAVVAAIVLEACFVAVVGSLVGVLLAGVAAEATNWIYRRKFETALTFAYLTPGIVATGIAISLGLGVVAGFLAALRLANARPLALWRRA
jgi:membrane protein